MLHKHYEEKDASYFGIFRNEMIKYLPKNARYVLDVGCGSGNLGKYLQSEKDCVVWGIEPDINSANEASQKLAKVFNTVFDNHIEFGSQKFDVIFFNDVLEHLIDPWDALEYSKKLLSTEGVVISSIPNILYYNTQKEILIGKDWKYADFGILDKTHLRFFTSKSIIRMYEETGYKIITHEGINPLHNNRLKLLEKIFPQYFDDMKFLQFATVATPNG